MDLLSKVRTLFGALVHKPFMPRPEKVTPPEGTQPPAEGRHHAGSDLAKPAAQASAEDTERVADLIQDRRSTTQ